MRSESILAWSALATKRGTVAVIGSDGSLVVELDDGTGQVVVRQRLDGQGEDRSALECGDPVLLCSLGSPGEGALLLGRIVRMSSRVEKTNGRRQAEGAPSSLVPPTLILEATDELTLRVGDGSITIRKDGKILIKGKDLVSHAQRMNRIKGGAVSIN